MLYKNHNCKGLVVANNNFWLLDSGGSVADQLTDSKLPVIKLLCKLCDLRERKREVSQILHRSQDSSVEKRLKLV